MKTLMTDIWTPFTQTKEEEFKQLNVKLKKSCTGLGVSEAERKEIIQATGLRRGHWYMCPNGHPYAIGECGGAMQVIVDFKIILKI